MGEAQRHREALTRNTPGRHWLFLALLAIVTGSAPLRTAAAQTNRGPVEVEFDELASGLVATYRSLVDPDSTLRKIEAKPAFAMGHSTPHPAIPPGPFEVTWKGLLLLREAGSIRFDAWLCGELTVEVDGQRVLQGRGGSERARVESTDTFKRALGLYQLAITYRSLPGLPARLQIWWQGANFAREPLPPWQLKHLLAELPLDFEQEVLAHSGRELVGRYGCARCHRDAFPGVSDAPPGPVLAGLSGRVSRDWLVEWLGDPSRVRQRARMPSLFTPDRTGFVERSIVADYLLAGATPRNGSDPRGDHRMGRRQFIGLGCATCHLVPDGDPAETLDANRTPLVGFAQRLPVDTLVEFLLNPHSRYPDGRMPRIPMTADVAQDIAAFLLLWSDSKGRPSELGQGDDSARPKPASSEEVAGVGRRLGARSRHDIAEAIIREKRCADCHLGLAQPRSDTVPIAAAATARGCLTAGSLPRFSMDDRTRQAIATYYSKAAREKYPSSFDERQRLVRHFGCVRCHQRDHDRPSTLEEIGSLLGGAWLQSIPFQRAPRLTYLHQKYTASHLRATVRDGVSGLRPSWYTYRMPAFGHEAELVLDALAEADGDLPAEGNSAPPAVLDPTLGPLVGPQLVGFQGYSCVSCHVWNGQMLSDPDPGASGPDLTRVASRIRRDWFDRFLENPLRFHPGTPMPSVFPRGQPATLRAVLEGDSARQRDALWAYLAMGKDAPAPRRAPPFSIVSSPGEPVLVAQIPLHMPGQAPIESISVLNADHDLLVYDVGATMLRQVFVGGQILRSVQGRLRNFTAAGQAIFPESPTDPTIQLVRPGSESPPDRTYQKRLLGYHRLTDGARIRSELGFAAGTVSMTETIAVPRRAGTGHLVHAWRFENVPADLAIEIRSHGTTGSRLDGDGMVGRATQERDGELHTIRVIPDGRGIGAVGMLIPLPAARSPEEARWTTLADPGLSEGSLARPGYRAIAYPRPKLDSGEDAIMPVAVAADPRDGRVFVASMKLGEIFVVNDPTGDGREARFEDFAHGLFQEAYSMLAEPDALYVLHRRNITRLVDTDGDGRADRFDRVHAMPQSVADAYDYGYGLVRDRSGAFVFTMAPHANQQLAGSGSALRLVSGRDSPEEIAFGFRNPLGWCAGPEGEIFFTDNQGEWVATNKLCHVVPGRYYGYPNPKQPEHATKPRGRTAIWVPYAWARSINGVAYDGTSGKFGPFAGQVFMAELMFGGAIIRANLERVNGEYQGACFPFWGKGLLGRVSLAFDPSGRLWVGGITEPGWMAQPDRGAVFRIEFTGESPFEMQSMHARPRGFRIQFTARVDPVTAGAPESYRVEHYRYEYTGAYGSPELDRTSVPVERAQVSADHLSVELTFPSLVQDRVYMVTASGVRSQSGEALYQATGAYTLNEIPAEER